VSRVTLKPHQGNPCHALANGETLGEFFPFVFSLGRTGGSGLRSR
jgi:hypothetical protein